LGGDNHDHEEGRKPLFVPWNVLQSAVTPWARKQVARITERQALARFGAAIKGEALQLRYASF
jgi:hypothetical protein